ncbi:MAG: orc1/cdc6 family replication initiation protein [Fervidicoccaceae archaeon]
MKRDVVDEIFERALASRIFKDRDKLSPDYVPSRLPFREEQISKLASILAQALRGYKPNNVLVYGLTGTGKTAVVRYVLSKLGEKANELRVPLMTVYVNCRQKDTEYRVLAEVLEALGVPVPFTGLSVAELYKRLARQLDRSGSRLIVSLDEVDYVVKRHGDDLLYRLLRLNSELSEPSISLIGITNDLNFVEELDPRVKSSLGEEELVFPPYDAQQLKSILEERAGLAFREGVLGEGVIGLCAALAAREHGDARKALDLLRVAGEIAEREGAQRVEVRHVEAARNQLERDKIHEVVSTLPLHAKLILLAALSIAEAKGRATTGEVYAKYLELAARVGIESVTQRRATDILSELDMLGIVTARVISRGRYGKTKIVSIRSGRDSILEALRTDELVSRLLQE